MKRYRAIVCLLAISPVAAAPLCAQAAKLRPISCEAGTNNRPVVSCQPESPRLRLKPIGTYRAGFFNSNGAEIVAHERKTQRLFVVNVGERANASSRPSLDALDINNPARPIRVFSVDLSDVFEDQATETVPTSVAASRGIVALAVRPAVSSAAAGKVLIYNAHGRLLNSLMVGFAPDMITFGPKARFAVVANGGTGVFPGSVSIIRLNRGIKRATVVNVDLPKAREVPPGVRFPGFLSPEYIAVSNGGRRAWVTLQINNALAVVDVKEEVVTDVLPLGFKDYRLRKNGFVAFDGSRGRNALDASDRDDTINVANWPVFGMYQPDAIAAYRVRGKNYLVTANEGDEIFEDERSRVRDIQLDAEDFPNASELQDDANLGRLRISNLSGDPDNDDAFDQLFVFGGRSFSIWSDTGALVFDSGDDFEQIAARIDSTILPGSFNNNDGDIEFDTRSDDKGPEPEGVTVGRVDGRTYAFVVLERPGGVMVYDVTHPRRPRFQQYVNFRNYRLDPKKECVKGEAESRRCARVRDLGPEGVLFIPRSKSPIGDPLVVTANETSGSTTIYRVKRLGR